MNEERAVSVLISGRGSNLKSLHENRLGYGVKAVISNRPDAGGLEYAKSQGIPTKVVQREHYPSLAAFKAAVLAATAETEPDLVALAGFMMVLQPEFIEHFYGRLINIHPSLLPQFPGLETHERAVAAKVRHHGCSVHFVDGGVDTGPLIAQSSLALNRADTAHDAAARVLALEHALYPWVLSHLALGGITLSGRTVQYSPEVEREATQRGFLIFPS
jgi:phosphoribosylglycinamide formyltransferase-1